MRICRRLLTATAGPGYYSLRTDAVELRLWFLTDTILRIRAGFDGDWAERSYTLLRTAWPDAMDSLLAGQRQRVEPAPASLSEEPDRFVLTGAKLRVEIEKEPFRLLIYDAAGNLLHADIPDIGYHEDSNRRRIHTSEMAPEDAFYGFGEKTGPLDKRLAFMTMDPGDALGYNPLHSDPLYKHIPFYIKMNRRTRGAVGYFYHNTAICDFDMGRQHSNYWAPHTRYRTEAGDIDLFFIAGPAITDVIAGYTFLTGTSAMLPKYALGYLGSSMYYAELPKDCDSAIEQFVDTARSYGFPIDGFQLSSGYTTYAGKRCVFTWNKDRFPDPPAFFQALRERGVEVSPNVKPALLLMHPLLPVLQENDIFVRDPVQEKPSVGAWWGGRGVFVDFTDPHARTVWKALLQEHVLEKGTTSVWNDNCEYEGVYDKDARVCLEGAGGTVGAVRSVMSNLMCLVTDEAIRETSPGERPFIVCRAGHAGIQRLAQTWAGDNYTSWDSLRGNIATILGMGLSGVANHGCDIGGFFGPRPEPELLVRWVQNGIFQPRFSIHSTNTDNTVTEPWMYPDCTDLIREAIRLRYRLFPYLYTRMAYAHKTGLPIWQAMVCAFQNDPACDEQGIDFMVGDALLVANVVEPGAAARCVYLPKEEVFYDLETRRRYEGGQTLTLPVTLASIPAFLRAGQVLMLADNQMDNLRTQQVTDLRLLLATDRDASGTYYEDDGLTEAWREGGWRKTRIELKTGEACTLTLTPEGSYPTAVQRVMLDLIHPGKAPFWVSRGDAMLPQYLDQRRFASAETGWYYNPGLQSVQIKYTDFSRPDQFTISFEPNDLLGM